MDLKEKLKTLPLKPGCYLMKDASGKVIYVGKAIKLKNRVNSYFRGAHDYKTTKLVSQIKDFDYIITQNEKEALITEYNLIKEYNPYFNIAFKDDKSYPYILLHESKEPYISVVRLNKKHKYKGKLFGPMTDVKAARNIVEILNRLYPTRKCKNLGKEYCLYYHMGECLGYCKNKINDNELSTIKNNIEAFINGESKEMIKDLKKKMNKETEMLNFEKAAYYRDLIEDIKITTLKQNVQVNTNDSFDVFNAITEDGYISIVGLFIRKGRIISVDKHIDYLVGDLDNYLSTYLYNFYQVNEKPKKLIVPSEILVYKDAFDIKLESPVRGKIFKYLNQCKENALEYLKQHREIVIHSDNYLNNMDKEFKKLFNKQINRIELFDNSHTSGKDTVGAMVVFKDFKPCKSEYRLYKLEDSSDDLNSMEEMLYRRYFRVVKDNLEKPDLLIVDGGINQIKVAKKILESLNIQILICGLGKDNHHNTSYIMDSNYNKINIDPKSNLFFFLTSMQDEVHRFAITYHTKLRAKNIYKSFLDDIPGISTKTRTKLLSHFKSIDIIKKQSLDDLEKVISKKAAKNLFDKIQSEK